MIEIIVSSFNNRDDREIDEYHDESNSSDGNSNESSSENSSSYEAYSFGTLGIPFDVL